MAHTPLAVPPYVCVFVEHRCVCECVLLLHSHFPLQVERLLYVVVATAQVDESDIAADRHLPLVLLLQLEGTLQVLGGCQNKKNKAAGIGDYSCWKKINLQISRKRSFQRLGNDSNLFNTESLDELFKDSANWLVLGKQVCKFLLKDQNLPFGVLIETERS